MHGTRTFDRTLEHAAPLAAALALALASAAPASAGPLQEGLQRDDSSPEVAGRQQAEPEPPATRQAPDQQEPTGDEAGSAAAVDAHGGREVLRHAWIRAGGVTVRNLPDVQGHGLIELGEDTLVAVLSEQGGWYEVDAPGGFPVWVLGRYLRPAEQEGVVVVNGNRINMRALPNTDVNNFPLYERLQAGDHLAVIETSDPDRPMSEVWVRVWSPPGAGGWIQADRTRALAREEDGADLWLRAERAAALGEGMRTARRDDAEDAAQDGRPIEAGAPVGQGGSRPKPPALARLEAVREEFARERERELPDFDQYREKFLSILELDPDPLTRNEIEKEVQVVDSLKQVHELRQRLEEQKAQNLRDLIARQQAQWERARELDPLSDRYDLRGRLERIEDSDGTRTYRLWRGREPVAEFRCVSGRYDLELFVGCEVGVLAERIETEDALRAEFLQVDVERLEVLRGPRAVR